MLVSIIILAPFIGSIFLGSFYLAKNRLKLSQNFFAVLGMIAPTLSMFSSALLLYFSSKDPLNLTIFNWIHAGIVNINIGFYLDKLSLMMTFFVTFLATLIHLYSVGYMDKDEGFGKFFAYMNLFLGSMLILVLANNPVLMFVGWEGVGACSYLLISFYFGDKDNVKAGNKAFIINRIGDFGFVIGLLSLYLAVGASGFDYISLANNVSTIPYPIAIFIAFCFICGALAKSAQIPLYTWLPDAMAGPTPISALIHAATMVTAGVYMIIRFGFLYENLSFALEFLAIIGATSAIFAAIIATKATDIKKILAYSTMSQLGYMFVGLSFDFNASLFHLFTHGFFKALLFLGAGSIIIALHHEQNIFKMGGLHKNKILFYPMLFGSLAISGIFPFSGFFSKDGLILGAFLSGHYFISALLLFTAGLTSYYIFRLFFLVFYSKNSSPKQHSLPFSMTFVNIILSILALFGGVVGLALNLEHIALKIEITAGIISIIVACIGIFIAYKKFYNYEHHDIKNGKIATIIINKFYVDELYELVFVRTFLAISYFISEILDKKILSPLVIKIARFFKVVGRIYTAYTQNGQTNTYLVFMLLWICVIIICIKVLV